MIFNFTYDLKFEALIAYLRAKYPEKLFDIEGIGKQTDLAKFSKDFFASKSTSDVSVDANSNVDEMSVIAYNAELPKPFFRVNSLYLLWKYARQLYDETTANQIIESQLSGEFYINDLHGLNQPYCFNFSCYDIMTQGLPFVKKIKSSPPKHLSSFIGQMIHFTVYGSNSILGAVGLADFLIVTSYYVKKLMEENIYSKEEYVWQAVKQEIQSFIYSCNQPFRAGLQSGFYNISVFDDVFLDKMCAEYLFPDMTNPDKEIIKKLQILYMDLMNETLRATPITFPVTTACLSVDEDKNVNDLEFLKLVAEKNLEFAYINMYFGATSTLSSCCFDGNQKVLTRSSNGVKLTTIREAVEGDHEIYRTNFTVFHNGSWVKAKPVKIKKDNKMFKIKTANNKTIIVTDNHINLTQRGNIETSKLNLNDYLAFSSRPLNQINERQLNYTYEQGVFIGMYLGDGSRYSKKTSKSFEVTLSLSEQKIKYIPLIKKALLDFNVEEEIRINYSKNNVIFVKIFSKKLFDITKDFVYGNYSFEKEINLSVLEQNIYFRKGIIDGWYFTDGGNSNRIYSTSEKLIEQGETIITSLGYSSRIDLSDRTEEPVIIRGETFKRNYPLYCLRFYTIDNKRSMGDVYQVINNTEYFKIISIEEYKSDDEYVYCFEMLREIEPYFTLPNGIITHNCRLRSETKNEYFNQFGAGGTKIGSLGVVTLNLPRIAYEVKGDFEKFFVILKERAKLVTKINNTKRFLLNKRIKNGSLPLYDFDFMNITTQYSTTGINGVNEAVNEMGLDILQEDGQKFVIDILDIINNVNEVATKQYNSPHNCEQTPSENSAIKLATKDKMLGFQEKYPLYSNQFIPLTTNADMLDRIKLQGLFDSKMTGGAICHINVENRIEDINGMTDLMLSCANKGVIYFAINYILQECEDGHMTVGKNELCPICNKGIINNYTRVVGFLTNTKNWSPVRREFDFPNRVFYKGVD